MADENFNNYTEPQQNTNPQQNAADTQNAQAAYDTQPLPNNQANYQAPQQPQQPQQGYQQQYNQQGYQQQYNQQPNYQQQNYQQYNQAPNQQFYPPYQQQPQEQKASVGLAILSFIFPIVGLILFLTLKSKRPKTAKVSGICALVSFILGIIISIVGNLTATFFVTENALDDDSYYSDYYDYDDSYDDTYYEYYG